MAPVSGLQSLRSIFGDAWAPRVNALIEQMLRVEFNMSDSLIVSDTGDVQALEAYRICRCVLYA